MGNVVWKESPTEAELLERAKSRASSASTMTTTPPFGLSSRATRSLSEEDGVNRKLRRARINHGSTLAATASPRRRRYSTASSLGAMPMAIPRRWVS